ncbi:zinc-binding protein A33-like [Engraulis encrasicolus]|uniref:zinc-binding protein A33-like n=1 Tax=Engraulis encrasicolus TaxID=184585 RepID=UPI002FD2C04F
MAAIFEPSALPQWPNKNQGSEVLCHLHSKKFELFCLEDKQPVCLVCRDSKKHIKHTFRPVDEAASDFKLEMKAKQMTLEKSLQNLQDQKCIYDTTAQHIKSQVQQTETQIKKAFEMLHQYLRDEETARIAALREEEEQKSQMMEKKIEEMSREISSLSDTIRAIKEEIKSDDVTFLQNFKITEERAQCTLQDPERLSGALINVAKHLGNLKFRVWEKMQETVQYIPVTLDPNTAHPELAISEDMSSVRQGEKRQHLPDNPERFRHHWYVLGSEGFDSGTHYWDVEVGENNEWSVGVMADSFQRKGDFSTISGQWFVNYYGGKYRAGAPPQPPTLLTMKQKLQRIRVQLDWDRGELTFTDPHSARKKDSDWKKLFSLSNTDKQIHTFKISFTEKVYPFLNTGPCPLRIVSSTVSTSEKRTQF